MKTLRNDAAETAAAIASALAKSTADVTAGIMHELSDIKTNLAVNTTETHNLASKLDEMKTDTKEKYEKLEPRLSRVEKLVYMGLGGLAVINGILWILKWVLNKA